MPPREILAYLQDALDAAREVQAATADFTLDMYLESSIHRRACERCFQIIGEALRSIEKVDAEALLGVDEVRSIVGFRNVVVHAYFELDHARVWDFIQTHLPVLIDQLQRRITLEGGDASSS